MVKNTKTNLLASIVSMLLVSAPAMASEADLVVPEIAKHYPLGHNLLLIGIAVSVLGFDSVYEALESIESWSVKNGGSLNEIINRKDNLVKKFLK